MQFAPLTSLKFRMNNRPGGPGWPPGRPNPPGLRKNITFQAWVRLSKAIVTIAICCFRADYSQGELYVLSASRLCIDVACRYLGSADRSFDSWDPWCSASAARDGVVDCESAHRGLRQYRFEGPHDRRRGSDPRLRSIRLAGTRRAALGTSASRTH